MYWLYEIQLLWNTSCGLHFQGINKVDKNTALVCRIYQIRGIKDRILSRQLNFSIKPRELVCKTLQTTAIMMVWRQFCTPHNHISEMSGPLRVIRIQNIQSLLSPCKKCINAEAPVWGRGKTMRGKVAVLAICPTQRQNMVRRHTALWDSGIQFRLKYVLKL